MTKYVYICSAGHSGSTLLDLLLGSHSQAESLGEIAHLPKNISLNTDCTCGVPVKSCKVWQPIIEDLSQQLDEDLNSNPYSLNTGFPKAVIIVDRNHQTPWYLIKRKFIHGLIYLQKRFGISLFTSLTKVFYQSLDHRFMLYDKVRQHQNVSIVIDSSKTYLEAISLYEKRPQDVRVILLARDGRGVMYSNMKRNLGRRNGLIGWKHYYSRALPLIKKHVNKSDFLTVHYEDIAQKTDSELLRICQFLGVEFEPEMKNFNSHEHHITNGNDMRFAENSEIRLDTSWNENLSEKDYQYFERSAGELNRSLGYK